MVKLKLKLKDGFVSPTGQEGDQEIVNPTELIISFKNGTIAFTHGDESGPMRGEFALADLDDIDWEVDEVSASDGLTTYQLRAMRNLPPVIPGMPDMTYDPVLPRTLKPTAAHVPDKDAELSGAEK